MGVHFTEDQQRAIDTLDKSILVSAAAGSGKTAVLVERIIHIILEGKANVDAVSYTHLSACREAGNPPSVGKWQFAPGEPSWIWIERLTKSTG